MSDLRERISEAIAAVDDWRGVTDPAILADAVIAELRLRPDRSNQAWDAATGRPMLRYVTEWTADE